MADPNRTVQPRTAKPRADPLLSVVVTVVDGGDALHRLLRALGQQHDPPPLEILVPYDASIADTRTLARSFPSVRFLDLGELPVAGPWTSAAVQHELYDRRRAAGLASATGELIAILEDRGIPRADWARNVVRHHEQPYAVIGGAVECRASRAVDWAFYLCDFGRYALPLKAGPAEWVTDVNVSYKRAAIARTRALWRERFHEPIVHWALQRQGETLYLTPELVVTHTPPRRSWRVLLPERFLWGRLFGQLRARRSSRAWRLAFTLVSPVVVPLLLVRHGSTQLAKRKFGRFLKAAPAMVLLLTAWTAGEAWGCLMGPPAEHLPVSGRHAPGPSARQG